MTNIVLKNRQNGFALAITLLIVGVIAATLASIIASEGGRTQDAEARIAGWQAVEIGRAARIFMRNEIANATPAPGQSNREAIAILANTPSDIPINDLIAQNLLPENFANRDGGGNFFNALGQRIRVIRANYPIGGNPTDETTIPTAYVYFISRGATAVEAELTQSIVQGARAENAPVSAPLFSGITNISGACSTTNPNNNGSAAAVIWDSNCLDTDEFTDLTGEAFAAGSFVLPVWRTVNFDTRAVLRFPQPEQTDLQTMQTDLIMANMTDCSVGNTIEIPIDAGDPNSGICEALSDDVGTGTDNRRAIFNVNNLESANLIINPQTGDDVTTVAGDTPDNPNDLFIGGQLTVIGDTKVFEGDTTISNNLTADRNIVVSGTSGPAASANVTTIQARNLNTGTLNVTNNVSVDANISISGTASDIGSLETGGDLIVQNASGSTTNRPTISTNGDASFLQPNGNELNVAGNIDIRADNNISGTIMSAATARISINNNAQFNVDLQVANGFDVGGLASANRTEVNNNTTNNAECFGDCPLRTEAIQCQNAADAGFTKLDDCLDALRQGVGP